MDHYVNEYHAEGVALSFEPATAEVLAKCSSLKIISVLAVGYDTVDVGAATSRGITVTNVPGYCDEEVALHAFAMALDFDAPGHLPRSIGSWGWVASADGLPDAASVREDLRAGVLRTDCREAG